MAYNCSFKRHSIYSSRREDEHYICFAVHGSQCAISSDCVGDSDILSQAYECDPASLTCQCNAFHNQISIVDKYMYMYGGPSYDSNAYIEQICQPCK